MSSDRIMITTIQARSRVGDLISVKSATTLLREIYISVDSVVGRHVTGVCSADFDISQNVDQMRGLTLKLHQMPFYLQSYIVL